MVYRCGSRLRPGRGNRFISICIAQASKKTPSRLYKTDQLRPWTNLFAAFPQLSSESTSGLEPATGPREFRLRVNSEKGISQDEQSDTDQWFTHLLRFMLRCERRPFGRNARPWEISCFHWESGTFCGSLCPESSAAAVRVLDDMATGRGHRLGNHCLSFSRPVLPWAWPRNSGIAS
jgi:hypothetical protein